VLKLYYFNGWCYRGFVACLCGFARMSCGWVATCFTSVVGKCIARSSFFLVCNNLVEVSGFREGAANLAGLVIAACLSHVHVWFV
jgi:hypothetical protein